MSPLVGTSRRFAAMQWFVGYRGQSGLSQVIRPGAFMSSRPSEHARVRGPLSVLQLVGDRNQIDSNAAVYRPM
jgi:hypothetical protein